MSKEKEVVLTQTEITNMLYSYIMHNTTYGMLDSYSCANLIVLDIHVSCWEEALSYNL